MADRDDLIRMYFHLGLKHRDIAHVLALNHRVIISIRHLRRILKDQGLLRRRYTDINQVVTFIQSELLGSGSLHGYR